MCHLSILNEVFLLKNLHITHFQIALSGPGFL